MANPADSVELPSRGRELDLRTSAGIQQVFLQETAGAYSRAMEAAMGRKELGTYRALEAERDRLLTGVRQGEWTVWYVVREGANGYGSDAGIPSPTNCAFTFWPVAPKAWERLSEDYLFVLSGPPLETNILGWHRAWTREA